MNAALLNIPEALISLPQWVCTKAGSKVPMQCAGAGAASSTNPSTWACFGEALRAIGMGRYDHVGFVFNNNGIVGIDIDIGYTSDGSISETATRIIGLCRSYTERSRSGRGFHIFVKGSLPFNGKNNLAGVEIYQSSRYFIMTGDVVFDYRQMVENQKAIDMILAEYFPESVKEGADTKASRRIYQPVWPKPENGLIPVRPEYPVIAQGGRNLSLTSLAGHLHTVGYGYDQIMDELMWVNRSACKPLLPTCEIEMIVRSITRYRR